MTDSTDVKCGNCGESRDSGLAHGTERPPCPKCDANSLHISVSITESALRIGDSISVKLKPAVQDRGWRQRWVEIQSDLKRMQEPHTDSCSSESIHRAHHELHSFYVQAYHLKDSLILDAPNTGVTGFTIESTITSDPDLALLADLANLDKHGSLTRKPRSGHVPRIREIAGDGLHDQGWRLCLIIEHNGRQLDGLVFAKDAVQAWVKQLQEWKLI